MAGKIKPYHLSRLVGGINTVSEINALNSFDFNGQGVGCEFMDMENYYPLNRGGLSRNKGFSLFFNTGSTNAINGITRFLKSDGTNQFIFSQSDKVYKLVSGVKTDLGITTSATPSMMFETAQDKLIICDALNKPFTYDGSTTGSITAAPAFAKQSLYYQNRLWVITDQSPNSSYVYYSAPLDITTGYGAQFVACGLNDGQKIVSINKYFVPGQLEPIILVCKTRSKGIITGTGTDTDPYFYVQIDQDTGGVSTRGVVQYGQQIAVLTQRGVDSYAPPESGDNNLLYNFTSEKVRPSFLALSQVNLPTSCAWYDWKNTRISFAVPEVGSQSPNVIWHYDIRLGMWYKERWNTGQDCTASFIDGTANGNTGNGDWYHGDSQGKLYLHDTSGGFNGQSIYSYFSLPYLDFGSSYSYKEIVVAKANVRATANASIGIGVKFDYGGGGSQSMTLDVGGQGQFWGGGTVWGDGSEWGTQPLSFATFYPGGPFQNISFTFSQKAFNVQTDIFELQFLTQTTGLI